MTSPILLTRKPQSGLSFPWAFKGRMNLRLGHDGGVAWSEVMQIEWGDLQKALVEILGYSMRDLSTVATLGVPQLNRKLPWQHPYANQLWTKNITDVDGVGMRGNSSEDPDDDFIVAGGGPGDGVPVNRGPWTEFERADLTIQFWRPPYYVRSDTSVRNDNFGSPMFGYQMEWLRYTDRKWSQSTQVLTRESGQLAWSGNSSNRPGNIPGATGTAVSHEKVVRTWYEIPEAAIFRAGQDACPTGDAANLMYSQTSVVNPITGFLYPSGYPLAMSLMLPIGGGFFSLDATVTAGDFEIDMASTVGITAGDFVTGGSLPTGTYVVSVGALSIIVSQVPTTSSALTSLTFVSDSDESLRMFGGYMGTLRYDHVEVDHRDLQLPPYLMEIPLFGESEPLSQQQCDVRFYFDRFDPPRANTNGARGHNLLPNPGNGLWYPTNFQRGIANTRVGPFPTPFPYFDPSDLFQIL